MQGKGRGGAGLYQTYVTLNIGQLLGLLAATYLSPGTKPGPEAMLVARPPRWKSPSRKKVPLLRSLTLHFFIIS